MVETGTGTRTRSGCWFGARTGEPNSPRMPRFAFRPPAHPGFHRAHIISPDASDAVQIRTPAVASFLQDVALRDLAVHATHAACVDGRGDVYQWGDGFFGGQTSAAAAAAAASGDNRKAMLTLQGKVRAVPPRSALLHFTCCCCRIS